MSKIYESHDVWKHIHKFSFDPKTINPRTYENLINEYKKNPNVNFSDLIKREYHIQIAPAFSDQINDPQPPWSDITFFRMYEDHPLLTQFELNKYQKDIEQIPPYILFDTIKCNFYAGSKPNNALWETLSGVIPYYQNRYGIDGARIDMGHALSSDLLNMIISKAREIDPHFCFIAEELDPKNDCNTRNLGYNMFIGSGFWHEPRYKERYLHNFMYHSDKLVCPIFACGETHDTPRLAAREGGKKLSEMLTILNMFVPNTVPFINSGQELYEIQPMNTGLDARPNEQFMLDETDRYYGKLALFDKYALHYLNPLRWDIPNILDRVSKIREHYISTISDITDFVPIYFDYENAPVIGFSYIEPGKHGETEDNVLMIFANTDPLTLNTTALLDNLGKFQSYCK